MVIEGEKKEIPKSEGPKGLDQEGGKSRSMVDGLKNKKSDKKIDKPQENIAKVEKKESVPPKQKAPIKINVPEANIAQIDDELNNSEARGNTKEIKSNTEYQNITQAKSEKSQNKSFSATTKPLDPGYYFPAGSSDDVNQERFSSFATVDGDVKEGYKNENLVARSVGYAMKFIDDNINV